MDIYEYMKLPLKIIPDEIIQKYKIQDWANKVFVFMEIQKFMYGMPQNWNIANDKLNQDGYDLAPINPGLRQHQKMPPQFSLLVDDFGVQ